jgi:3-isopropylmalate dehydrogenase
MMLKYSFGRADLAAAVDKAVKNAVDGGVRTKDIGGSASTSEAGDAIVEELKKVLKA